MNNEIKFDNLIKKTLFENILIKIWYSRLLYVTHIMLCMCTQYMYINMILILSKKENYE